jgi:Lon-like protease
VIPRETVYPEGVSEQEVQQRNAEEMRLSQQNATTAALRYLGYELPSTIRVVRIVADTPAQGALKAGDRILAVDGKVITETQQVPDYVRARTPGDSVTFTVMRSGTERKITMKTITGPEGQPLVGIAASAVYTYPFEVNIRLEDVGGPSAGLMFALGIIDRLTPGSLTKGRVIAGTGTIDDDGNVGSIGGIGEKLKGARGAGATLFLAPAENCQEITSIPDGLRVVPVSTLTEAMKILEGGKIPAGLRCGP